MLPAYDPKSFASLGLRKYHIRTVKDIVRFQEFVSSRMEEANFILKKFNNKLATFDTISRQLQQKVAEEQAAYGNPANTDIKEDKEHPEIQSVVKSSDKEHEELLKEIKSAIADENIIEDVKAAAEENEDPDTVMLGKYKLVMGKRGEMFYRDGGKGFKLVAKKDVPEDIQKELVKLLDK